MADLEARAAVLEERVRYLVRDHNVLAGEVGKLRHDVNVLGTAAKVAEAVSAGAARRERRLFALAGLALTAVNVAVAVGSTQL